ncbi:MAG: hypothetical protein ACK40Q_05325 [Pseudothermotoga sp.]
MIRPSWKGENPEKAKYWLIRVEHAMTEYTKASKAQELRNIDNPSSYSTES